MFLFFSCYLYITKNLTVHFPLNLREISEIPPVSFNKPVCVFVCLGGCTGKTVNQTSKTEVETEAPRQNKGTAEFPTELNFAEGQYLTH